MDTRIARSILWTAAIAASLPAAAPAHAAGHWWWEASVAADRPSGWVRVRENAIEGTQLHINDDLNVNSRTGFRLGGLKRLNERAAWMISLATYDVVGTTTSAEPVYYNGAALAPGQLKTTTTYPHFLQIDASYWRRFATFARGGSFWGGIGATTVFLNFKLKGTLDPTLSAGSETREDFDAQELPVPVIGAALQFPIAEHFSLIGSAVYGHLPRVNSLRKEGGTVRLEQTNAEVSLGLAVRLANTWRVSVAAFKSNFEQNEQSREDGNVIHLRDAGFVLSIHRPFGHRKADYEAPPTPWSPG